MAIGTGGNPNRQRMINLMYIVFLAMMALNISPEVLEGFSLVERELRETTKSLEEQNRLRTDLLASAYRSNPTKVALWIEQAEKLRTKTQALDSLLQHLKGEIAAAADRSSSIASHPEALERKDDLSASSEVLLDPFHQRGRQLREEITAYRKYVSELLGLGEDQLPQLKRLSTTSPTSGKSWEEAYFEGQPAIAAITLLTQLQNSLRYIEGEMLTELLRRIDEHDYRSNRLTAQVIPENRVVLQGEPFRAEVVLSSVDTTRHPRVFLGTSSTPLSSSLVTLSSTRTGTHPISGHIETELPDGTALRLPFSSEYTVVAPTASISPTLLNVLYAGIDNPLRIAVPGISTEALRVNASAGTLTQKEGLWILRTAKAGGEITISVSAHRPDGTSRSIAQQTFRVRSLPDPLPYLSLAGHSGAQRFKGGKISRSALLSAGEVKAALDDAFLDIHYTVLRFQLLAFDALGNALPENSNGRLFSERQLRLIRTTPLGRRLFITEIYAQGPDGIERRLPSLELLLY